jgi:hypothetical protein
MKADLFRACLHGLARLLRDRRGATAVLVALTLAALIGLTGLGVETGFWYAIRRYNQSAADVAALSGATEQAGGGVYQTDICALAKNGAKANGFTFDPTWSCPATSPTDQSSCTGLTSGQMCVNNPPLFSNAGHNGDNNYVEVVLAQEQSTFFSLLSLASANVKIDTRAVAGLKSFSDCMLALGTNIQDLKFNGTSDLTLSGCSFIANSTTSDSLTFNGNVTMNASAIQTSGGTKITGNSNSISPAPLTGQPAVSDPYAGQITYTLPGTTQGSCVTGGTLRPGWYNTAGCSGNPAPMNFSSGTTTLCSGIYYLDGEDNQGEAFVISGSGTVVNMGTPGQAYAGVTCPTTQNSNTIPLGVTFIATCSGTNCGGGFIVGGTGGNTPTVNLAAPTSAVPSGCTQPSPACIPAQILFYQPSSTADANKGNSQLAGGSGVSLNGVVYTPATKVTLQGNPTLGSCTEFIALNFVIGGTPTLSAPLGTCGINSQSVSTVVLAE